MDCCGYICSYLDGADFKFRTNQPELRTTIASLFVDIFWVVCAMPTLLNHKVQKMSEVSCSMCENVECAKMRNITRYGTISSKNVEEIPLKLMVIEVH